MTSTQLIENAKSINAKVSTEFPNQIGVQFNSQRYSGLWHWFDVYTIGGVEDVMFNHSYSQNTGRTKKGVRHYISVQKKLGFYK